MIKIKYLLIGAICLFFSLSVSLAEDIEALFKKMSYEDKCGQMTQMTFEPHYSIFPEPNDPNTSALDATKFLEAIQKKKIGSLLNTPYFKAQSKTRWHKTIKDIHSFVDNSTDLKIPILFGIDSIHGGTYIRDAVLFPQPLAMASSFNLGIAEKVGEITALETRAVGIPWNFNPVLDVGRQPLWPRIWETYGEDVHLAIKMGEAYIRGSQGEKNNLKDRTKTATCLKHYIGYSFPYNGLDRSVAYIPENLLREVFLPPFEAGLAAGSRTVMINSGEVNGLPGHANSFYINDILKGELKFDGFTVSDWEDIIRLYTRDKLAETPEDAVRIAVMAGVDMSMVPNDYSFFDHCVNLAKKNTKFAERVNDASKRILKVKNELGLFEKEFRYPVESDLSKIGTEESENFNLKAARESIILAKNSNNFLPLNASNDGQKIFVTGPTANLLKVLNGGWSYTWQGDNENDFVEFGRKKYTIFDAIKLKKNGATFLEGANFTHTLNFDATLVEAKKNDIIILCIGEDTYTETPGNIENLMISESQQELADALIKLGKKLVVVYIGGRPRIITKIAEKAVAVLIAFLPGYKGSDAIADILFGDYNPNGRLPITYPKHPSGYTTYDYKPIEEFDLNKYVNLYPFGHGLSYTSFTYSSLKLDTTNLTQKNKLKISVNVKNTGSREGAETVMLYIKDEVGSVSRPMRQLKGFKKINLKVNEEETVSFEITADNLSFIGYNNKRIIESGSYKVSISNLNASFVLTYDSTVPVPPFNSSPNQKIGIFSLFLGILIAFLKI